METTRLSTITIKETRDGLLLRPALQFAPVSLEEVAGLLKSQRKSKTPAQIRAGIGREVMRRHDRGRY